MDDISTCILVGVPNVPFPSLL